VSPHSKGSQQHPGLSSQEKRQQLWGRNYPPPLSAHQTTSRILRAVLFPPVQKRLAYWSGLGRGSPRRLGLEHSSREQRLRDWSLFHLGKKVWLQGDLTAAPGMTSEVIKKTEPGSSQC